MEVTSTDPRLVDPISAIQQRANEDLTLVDWSLSKNLTYAAVVAQRGSVCLPVVSSFAGEGVDRNLSALHDGDNLIKTVADNCDNTIPIVQSVGAIDMEVCKHGILFQPRPFLPSWRINVNESYT